VIAAVSDLIPIRTLTFRTTEWFGLSQCLLISFQMTFREVHESHDYSTDVAPHHNVTIAGPDDYFCASAMVFTSNAWIHGSYVGKEIACGAEVSQFSSRAIVMHLKSEIEIFEGSP
jgi:hypothetical protein